MRTAMQQVAEFHTEIVGRPPAPTPSILMDTDRIRLRLRLILEEVGELAEALGSDGTTVDAITQAMSRMQADGFTDAASLIETADALGDITYVTVGAALEMGLPLPEVMTEIHASNMTKSPSEKRGDGKVCKGEKYRPPNIKAVLDAARRESGGRLITSQGVGTCVRCGHPWGHFVECAELAAARRPQTRPQPLATDPVTRPDHYQANGYECREVIAALGLNFNVGAAFKYIWRAGRKGGESTRLQDLQKAIECLKHEVARLEKAK